MTKAEIQFVRTLSQRAERIASGLFVAEGVKLVGDLLESSLKVRRIYSLEESLKELPFNNLGLIEVVARKDMERISFLKTPSSVLALFEMPRHSLDSKSLVGRLTLALDGVQDPGNLGTIIRLADWFGIRDIVCSSDTVDCFNPKVVQATMGAISRTKVHYVDLIAFLKEYRTSKMAIYGTFLDGENIYNTKLSESGIIVMGSEGQGVSANIEKLVTDKLYIPSYPAGSTTSESLNVGIATAITCSEFRRQSAIK